MKLALIDSQGVVTVVDDEIEEYDLSKPAAQAMVGLAIAAALRSAREADDAKCPVCEQETEKPGQLCWYCDDEPED